MIKLKSLLEAGVPNHLRAGFKKLKNKEGLSIEEKDELTDAYRKLVDLLTYGKFYENGRPNQRRKEHISTKRQIR